MWPKIKEPRVYQHLAGTLSGFLRNDHPGEEEQSECPHLENRPPDPLFLPPPGGCEHLAPEACHAPAFFEQTRKSDILHKRDVGEPAERFEDLPANKHSLVSSGNLRQTGAEIHQGADRSKDPLPAI